MNTLALFRLRNLFQRGRRTLAVVALLIMAPLAAHAQTGIAVGYTGLHDGQRGRVIMFDYVHSDSQLDFTVANISGTTDGRDTSLAAVSYEIVDRHLYASFGPAVITHQTLTLSSQYQFMTTFGYHHDNWSLGVRHISNGGFRGKNIGENLVFMVWNF
jgi:hypothetical protein